MKRILFRIFLFTSILLVPRFLFSKTTQPDSPTPTGKNPGKAIVNFVVLMDWGDGSGYQLLLDTDHNTFDRIFNYAGFIEPDLNGNVDYSEFEIRIPANAEGIPETSHIIVAPDTISIELEPGTYDYIVTNPTPGDQIYMPGGSGSYANDITLSAGSSYTIIVQETDGSENCSLVIEASVDMALTELVVPESSNNLGTEESIKISVRNAGLQPIESFQVAYSVNGVAFEAETIVQKLEPQQEYSYTFLQKADLSKPGLYEIKAWVEAENDAVSANNSMKAKVDHEGPRPLPFICDFNQLDQWYQWNIIDNNKDNLSWTYYVGRDANDEISGYARMEYNNFDITVPMDDYLILKNPVSIESGQANISFRYNAGSADNMERLRVLYGETPDPGQMKILDTIEFVEKEKWGFYSHELMFDADGEYFFALHACSDAYTNHINIDDFQIEEGTFKGTPDLALIKVILPTSGCGLNEIMPGVVVANYGDAEIEEFTLTTILNKTEVMKETFTQTIAAETIDTLFFASPLRLEEKDIPYSVEITGTVAPDASRKPETNLSNNTTAGNIINYTPAELPFSTDFTNTEKPVEWSGEDWRYDADFEWAYQALGNLPLQSRCVTLETEREYHFRLEYKAGYEFIELYTEDFDILYGVSGTPSSEWKVLKQFRNHYTHKNYVLFDTAFSVAQSGEYAFAIVCHSQSHSLYLKTAQVSAILDVDVTLSSLSAPTIVPVEHLQQESGIPVSIVVRNSGRGTIEQVKVNFSDEEGTSLGEDIFRMGSAGTEIKRETSVSARNGIGEHLMLTAQAIVLGHEDQDSNPDNTINRNILVSDSVMAYDNVTEEMMGDNFFSVGSNSSYITTGIPFRVQARDTLTAASIAWHYSAGGDRVQIGLLPWNPDTEKAGSPIYSIDGYAGTDQGWKDYVFPGIIVDSGWYMLTLTFPGTTLTADFDKNGIIYVKQNDSTFTVQEGMGYPGMRLIFGHNAQPLAKDMSISSILHPNGDGFYLPDEEVVLKVTNQGFEKNKAKVHLHINDMKSEPVEVELAPYEICEVTIKADLSRPETVYSLVAFVEADQDDNPHNDTCTLNFKTYREGDPYVLDFELTNDFATHHFNPGWTTIDVDQSSTIGIQGFDFPGSGTKFAFMVFNPAKTQPSMLNTGVPSTDAAFTPVQGNRYGAVFCASVGINDDWLISPKLMLPKEGAKLSFYAKSLTESYGKERFNILISNTEAQPDNFTRLYSDSANEGEWQLFEYDLSAFGGKNLHLAIQCVSRDALMFMIDDIRISKPTANDFHPEELPVQISIYPNPSSDQIRFYSVAIDMNRIEIFNTTGKNVLADNINGSYFQLNVSHWTPGLYFAKIHTENGCVVKKIIVR